jgi:hypothetical protein
MFGLLCNRKLIRQNVEITHAVTERQNVIHVALTAAGVLKLCKYGKSLREKMVAHTEENNWINKEQVH